MKVSEKIIFSDALIALLAKNEHKKVMEEIAKNFQLIIDRQNLKLRFTKN